MNQSRLVTIYAQTSEWPSHSHSLSDALSRHRFCNRTQLCIGLGTLSEFQAVNLAVSWETRVQVNWYNVKIGYSLNTAATVSFYQYHKKYDFFSKWFPFVRLGICVLFPMHITYTKDKLQEWTEHWGTDVWKFRTNRDNQKIISTLFEHLKKCINFQNYEGVAQLWSLPRPF